MANLLDDVLNTPVAGGQAVPSNTQGMFSSALDNALMRGQERRAALAATADAKKAALAEATSTPNYKQIQAGMGNQYGANTMTPEEQDLRTLNPLQLAAKYGPDKALEMQRGLAAASNEKLDQTGIARTDGEFLADTAKDVATGFALPLADIASAGVGLVNRNAGAAMSSLVHSANEWVEGTQSDKRKASAEAAAIKSSLTKRDNEAKRLAEIDAGGSELVADLRRFGRDAIDSFAAIGDSGDNFIKGTAQGVGSLLAGGPIAAGLRKIGAGALAATGLSRTVAGQAAARAGSWAAWPATVGLMEGSGAYRQATSDVLEMSFEDLAKKSDDFVARRQDYEASGMTRAEANNQARIDVATMAGERAGAIQFPLAAATGLLTRFAERPFHAPTVRGAAGNILLKEPLEEGIQSTTGQIAQNAGIREYADRERSLSQDVGEQAVQGALYGLSSAGVTQGSGTAARKAPAAAKAVAGAVADVAKTVGKPVVDALVKRGEAMEAKASQEQTKTPEAPVQTEAAMETPVPTPDVNKPAEMSKLDEAVTEESVKTPEGQEAAKAAMAAVEAKPDALKAETVRTMLKHAKTLNLTDEQQQSLNASVTLLDAATKQAEKAEALGLKKIDVVGGQVVTNNDPIASNKVMRLSAREHTNEVMSLIRSGDIAGAKEHMAQFGEFVQHMQNKVGALNQHFLGGDLSARNVQYEAINAKTRQWYTDSKGLGVNTRSPGSIQFAQRVGTEAEILSDVYAGLAKAFPQLGAKAVKPVMLDAGLMKPASEIVAGKKEVAPQVEAEPVKEEIPALVTQETTTQQEPSNPEAKGLQREFPTLVKSQDNHFTKSFDLPAEATSRLLYNAEGLSPHQVTVKALSKQSRLDDVLGTEGKRQLTNETAAAYSNLLGNSGKESFGGVKRSMDNNLAKFLQKEKIDPATGKNDRIDFTRTGQGKALNIVNSDGRYNEQLRDSAILAGLQWMLTSNRTEAVMDSSDIEALTGVSDASLLDATIVDKISQGMSGAQAKRQLASKIAQYWGVKAKPDADLAYVEGIPEAVAAEVLRALTDVGLLKMETTQITEADGLPPLDNGKPNIRSITRIMVEGEELRKATAGFPNAIDTVAMVVPEETRFIGGVKPPVAKRQMNNPLVENTKDQMKALRNEGDTPFQPSLPMIGVYRALGLSGMQELFGAGDTSNRVFNVNYAKSADGKNRNVASAYEEIMNTVSEIQSYSEATGTEMEDAVVRYAYNISRVGRMQMLGKFNPQSNKQMREAILPTWSTLDIESNPEHNTAYFLSLAQALDIKVHKVGVAEAVQQVKAKLAGPLDQAVQIIENHLADGNGDDRVIQAKALKAAFGDTPLTAVALMAVVDYARLMRSESKDGFRTPIYLEADGVTNGPINAMVMMTSGPFTQNWINNIRKGGLSFSEAKPLSQIIRQDDVDLYQASAVAAQAARKTLVNEMAQSKEAGKLREQMTALSKVMARVFPKDIRYTEETDDLVLNRGIAKNPLTITIYGSSERGIAGKLSSMVKDEVYALFSKAADSMSRDRNLSMADAMFPGPDAQAKLDALFDGLNKLTSASMQNAGKEGYIVKSGKSQGKTFHERMDLVNFTFDSWASRHLTANMDVGFVKPMADGIASTVGHGLMSSVSSMRVAAQVQSIFLAHAYRDEIRKMLDQKREADPDRARMDFLSRNDLAVIDKLIKDRFPLVQTGDQSFLIAKTQAYESQGYQYGHAFNEALRSPADVYLPSDAGVAAIPFMTIGMGDGKMMQDLALEKNIKGTLKIFDGMNMPADKIKPYSEKANQAVFDSWMGNPLKHVADAFDGFLAKRDQPLTDDLLNDLRRPLGLPKEATVDEIRDMLDSSLETMQRDLRNAANEVEARHMAMKEFGISVDQMAGAESPYVHKGVLLDEGELLEALNLSYRKHLAGMNQEQEPAPKPKEAFRKVGRIDTNSGAQILTPTSVKKLGKDIGMTDGQKMMFDQAIRAGGLDGYKIIMGAPEQLAQYRADRGLAGLDVESHGFISVGDKTIYIENPTAETLVHEIVHAATYNSVLAHYQGNLTGEQAGVVADAVGRIEQMMTDFMATEGGTWNVNNAKGAIQEHLDTVGDDPVAGMANAVNEFMAWGLTNADTASALKATKVNPLVQIAKNVLKAIKQIVWGKKQAPKIADDVLSNLQFNTGVVMRSQPSMSGLFSEATLRHANDNPYLTEIRNDFDTMVLQHMEAVDRADPAKALLMENRYAKHATQLDEINKDLAAVFGLNTAQQSTLKAIAMAYGTELQLDSLATARAQEIFAHAQRTLKVEDFLDPKISDPVVASSLALDKLNAVLGKGQRRLDSQGRTTLLPVFLGLAQVEPGLRDVLSKMDLPKSVKVKDGAKVDVALRNIGNTLLDSLSARMSGEGQSKNARDAIDVLSEYTRQQVLEEQTALDQLDEWSNERANTLSDRLSGLIDKAAMGGVKLGEVIQGSTKIKAVQGIGAVTKAISSLASESRSDKVAESVLVASSEAKISNPLMNLIKDFTGRTETTANVYDMIKRVRAGVQQVRQQFREKVPQIISSKFNKPVNEETWGAMHRAMGKTDLASLGSTMKTSDMVELLNDPKKVQAEVDKLVANLKAADSANYRLLDRKMQQLARFMVTGEYGSNLLKNANAISQLWGEKHNGKVHFQDSVRDIDQLVSLYAIQSMNQKDMDNIRKVIASDRAGVEFVADYLRGQRAGENGKGESGNGFANSYKGYVPSTQNAPGSLIIDSDAKAADLSRLGYTRIGRYQGSSLDKHAGGLSYYLAPLNGRSPFSQGIAQNVKASQWGADEVTGYTDGLVAGRIADKKLLATLAGRLNQEQASSGENLIPIYSDKGQLIGLERAADPKMLAKIQRSDQLHEMLGVWRGRQVEEKLARATNYEMVNRLKQQYDTDMRNSGNTHKSAYVNLFGDKLDTVQAEAVALISKDTRAYIEKVFGKGQFLVRRDQIEDVVGYRNASVGDFWTGSNRYSKETNEIVRKALTGFIGLPGINLLAQNQTPFEFLVKNERRVQGFMSDMRTMIVVKSVIVPAINFVSNIYQLTSRGVSPVTIGKGMPAKQAEIHGYVKSRNRQIELESEIRAASDDPVKEARLRAEIRSITDSHKRLSIWPLIEAGEFSTIADVGAAPEDLELSSGKIGSWLEKKVDELPAQVKNLARYGLITRDTALFQGLQRSVQYGDFLAKAVLYDHLTKRRGLTQAEALGRITEEFVNYDRLTGRTRGYAENIGLLWFYNFKLRIAKVALSTIRNNPLFALTAAMLPMPMGIGLPTTDNIVAKGLEGTLGYSMGAGMAMRAPSLNPWYSLF